MQNSCGHPSVCQKRLAAVVAQMLVAAAVTWAASPAKLTTPPAPPVDKDHAARMARGLEIFKKDVRPALVARCLKCHGGKKVESQLDLTDRHRLLKGGLSGPAVVPGNAQASLLYKLITHAQKPHMPHKSGQLPALTIARIAAWIDSGAPYDAPLVLGRGQASSWTQKLVPAEARQFWSFRPLERPEPPRVEDSSWCRTLIDRFILAKLEAAGIKPNPPVNKRHLIRRAYFDLIGLPPTPEQVEAFVKDLAPDAYEKMLDRLLDSPYYGERWARHWLDLARFAESHGFEHDYDRPYAYHYRDFVIKALDIDLPYDTFVKWQLAGDEFAPDNNLALAATGFLAAGVHSTQITKKEVARQRYDEMDDMLATIGTSMLGLTIGCARCHDHKFDPIPQGDYYRLLSSFTTTVRTVIELNLDRKGYEKAKAAFDKEHAPYVAALKKFESEQLPARLAKRQKSWASRPDRFNWVLFDVMRSPAVRMASLVQWSQVSDPEWRKMYQQVQDHLKKAPKPLVVQALIASEGLPPVRLHTQGDDFFKETYFLRRGDPDQKVGLAPQGFLQVLMTGPDKAKRWHKDPPKGWHTSYRRRALAEWITDVDQGAGRLLARVIVNRLWQHHMGRGIVATPSDFGTRGEPPTHPELLDWLAGELIRSGWRLKPIHKLIMSSAVYRQSSRWDEAKAHLDSANRWFWHRPPHRLEAEVIRDTLLAVSGMLDMRMFGPGTLDEGSRRRSIYFTVKRSQLIPMMHVFDSPDALTSIGDRPTTTIAPQALLLMNNPNVRNYAKHFARRIAPDERTTVAKAINSGYMIALSRMPAADELADAVAFVKQQSASYQAAGKRNSRELALADFCQMLMCLNEFVYVE